MKVYLYVLSSLLCVLSCTTNAIDNFDIILKPKWQQLNSHHETLIDFGGEWVLIGSITFKKKSKKPVILDTISFRWNGEQITSLIASLYKKNSSKNFLPIDQNLICDGTWNRSKQTLVFNFNEKESLNPMTTFYIVLTMPPDLKSCLQEGLFILEEQCLPKPFKHAIDPKNLTLKIAIPSE